MVQVGSTLGGKYLLRRLIGDGGMGSVYEAEHVKLGTKVAVKVLHADLARRPGLIDRFLREARVAAQIKSAHVVHVTDVDQTPDGVAYLVMDLLEGEPLSSMLERERKIPVARACEYTRQMLEALEAAHAIGVVHRDLKPENVFITYEANKPVLKLIDFGIAKLRRTDMGANLTVAGIMMGTAEYMAPEQAFSADKVDARADLYSIGVMLFEMLAGVRPVTGEDARVIAVKVERGEVTPLVHVAPDAPREIAGLVHRAMAHNPDLRFASAAEMRLALEGALSGKRPPTAPLPVVQANVASLEGAAGTGTVLGAPVEAALKQPTGIGTAYGSTVRAAPPAGPSPGPMPMPAYTPSPPMDDDREASSGGGGGGVVKALIALLVLGALGGGAYGIYWYVDSNSGGAPTSTPTLTTAPPTVTPTTPTAQTAAPTGSLSPLTPATVTAPTTPTQTPSGKPTASTQPTSTPSGSATTEPTVPPIGPIVIPGFTNDAGVFTMPTTMPSFPFPFPAPSAPPP